MRGEDPDTGEASFDGPPRASQRREDANHPWFFDSERQPVSAISSTADDGSPNSSDPEALVRASRGGLGGRPAESVEQAARQLAGIAKLLSPGLTTFETGRESGAKLVQKLDELEVRLRNRGPGGSDSLTAALAGLEAEFRASPRMPATVEPPGQKTGLRTGSEGAAERAPSVAGGMASNHASCSVAEPVLGDPEKDVAALAGKLENACDDLDRDFGGEGVDRDGKAGVLGAEARQGVALETPVRDLTGGAQTIRELGECTSSLDQFDRLARVFQRSLTQLEAAKAYKGSFEGHGAENPVPETFPAPSMNPAHYDALTRHIETSHRQLAARLEAGLAAGANEMHTLRDLVADAANKMELAREPGQGQSAGAALEPEIAKLALRLDCAGEGLASLTSLECSSGGLSVQPEETRRIVSGLSNAAEPKPSNGPGSVEDAQSIMRGIDGLRALHEETAQQARLALTVIQESVEQVAGYCARLEAAAGGMRPDRRGAGIAPEDPFAPILTYLAQLENPLAREALADDGVQGAGKQQPAAHGDAAGEPGFLIEPGLGFPGRDQHSERRDAPPKASQVRDEGASRTDFIAAARRAARTAQMELDGATSKSLAGDDGRAKPGAFPFGRSWGLFVTYKRPLVLGAAVLFAAIGAYALARTLAHHNLNDFVPDFLRQSGRAAEHGKSAGGASRTFASMTPKGRLPATQARRNEAPGGQLPAAGAASTMTALLDPSRLAAPAEPGFPSDSTVPFGKLSPATRAIAGSDAIVVVAGSIRASNIASISAPPRPPAATVPAKALPSAALAATPAVPSAGPLTARAAPPAVGPNENLVGKAEAGDAAAQFDLAVRYAEGGAGPRNYELAAQWYEKAAQQGIAVAEYRLASLYEKGLGVGKDIQRAKDLYQRAAEKGNTRAMYNLGVLAADGTGGKPNYTSAALWFGKAAEYGIRDSQFNLAVLLARGLGLPKDLVKSYTWFAIVAAAGDADAARKRDDVAARLTSSELAAANAAAAGFAPRPADHAANEITPPPTQLEAAPAQGQPVKPKVSGL
jgi:localization factor PodJL